MTIEWLLQSGEIVLTAAGILGVVIMAIKKVYRIARNIESLLEKVDSLSAETRPNGGSTLRDAVDRIELDVRTLRDRVEHLEDRVRGAA